MKQENKDWENITTTKVTATVESEIYEEIKSKFYHGQMTSLIRNFIYSIQDLIRDGKILAIVNYIHGEKDLVLPIKKDMSNDSK